MTDSPRGRVKTVALLSGKGGSGKTMIAASLARALSDEVSRVALVDADLGTGGLSYYLGLKNVTNIRPGFSELIAENNRDSDLTRSGVDIKALGRPLRDADCLFVPVGDHRRLLHRIPEVEVQLAIRPVIGELIDSAVRASIDVLIFDCRGGIDGETLEICKEVDGLILIVEPDTTSFQATSHLTSVLSDSDLAHKLLGFIINKAFEDPSVVARNGSSTFGARFLGAIPFDIDATRAFLVGEIPSRRSQFARQLFAAAATAFPDEMFLPFTSSILSPRDYNQIRVLSPDAVRGRLVSFFLSLLVFVGVILEVGIDPRVNFPRSEVLLLIGIPGALCLLGYLPSFSEILGRVLAVYARMFRLLGARRR